MCNTVLSHYSLRHRPNCARLVCMVCAVVLHLLSRDVTFGQYLVCDTGYSQCRLFCKSVFILWTDKNWVKKCKQCEIEAPSNCDLRHRPTHGRLVGMDQETLEGEMKGPYIRKLQCAVRAFLQKAVAVRSYAIFFPLYCGTKPQNYGLVLACFSLSCNPGAMSLSSVAFHMDSDKTRRYVSPANAPLYGPCNGSLFAVTFGQCSACDADHSQCWLSCKNVS